MIKNKNLKPFLIEQKKKYLGQKRDVRFLAMALGRIMHDFAPHTDADLKWVQDEILSHLSPKLNKQMEIMQIGAVTALLVGHDSSFEQAKKAMAQWLLISETKIRDAYNKVRQEYDLVEGDASILENHDFRMTFIYEPSVLRQLTRKAFPKDFPKAYKAMQAALKAGDLYAEKGPASFND
jgi:hypothetical protein